MNHRSRTAVSSLTLFFSRSLLPALCVLPLEFHFCYPISSSQLQPPVTQYLGPHCSIPSFLRLHFSHIIPLQPNTSCPPHFFSFFLCWCISFGILIAQNKYRENFPHSSDGISCRLQMSTKTFVDNHVRSTCSVRLPRIEKSFLRLFLFYFFRDKLFSMFLACVLTFTPSSRYQFSEWSSNHSPP